MRILSGIRPTGGIHLGNYLGSLKQWVDLSHESEAECFFSIVDYHALLSFRETPLDTASLDLLAWQLASGLDPQKVTIFLQSAVSAHPELAWIFNTLVTVAELGRMTQYKDLIQQGTEQATAALLTYPLLQAADILLYKATIVPVGEDQVQHVELTRTVARRFNTLVNQEIFPEVRPRLTSAARILSLHDPTKKMSKSLPQGALLLQDDEATLRSKISKAVTDTGPGVTPLADEFIANEGRLSSEERALLFSHMTPGVRNLFVLLQETGGDSDTLDALLHNYKAQSLAYRDLKAAVADAVVAFIAPLRQRYNDLRPNEDALRTVLHDGSAKAHTVADATLQEVKNSLHILG